jgi:hypothetical protein
LPSQGTRAEADGAALGGPYPNPSSVELARHIVPCMTARIDQWRFKAASDDWWLWLDVQVD